MINFTRESLVTHQLDKPDHLSKPRALQKSTVRTCVCCLTVQAMKEDNHREGDTSIYGLYRYVPQGRVWFLRFFVLK